MKRIVRALANAWQKVDDENNRMCVRDLSYKCMPSQYWHCINELLECWL